MIAILTAGCAAARVAPAGCDIRGYPRIALAGTSGRALGFTYRKRSDAMLTGSPPELVPLAPGMAAYTAFGKSPCPHAWSTAHRIWLWPPGTRQPLVLTLPAGRTVDYCGPPYAGYVIDITPVEPAISAIHARH